MDKKTWDKLSKDKQDQLVQKFGVTRSGADQAPHAGELDKIPEPPVEKEVVVKKVVVNKKKYADKMDNKKAVQVSSKS